VATFYTTNSLIEAIKLKGMIPTSQNTIKTDDFITFINEEMDLGVLPHILAYHEDNLSRSELVPIVSGERRYAIPSRAIGNKIKDVYLQDSSGNLQELTRISNGDLADYNRDIETYPGAFYLEGDSIVLLASPTSSQNLRFIYHLRPNRMVKEDRAAKIIAVDGTKVNVASLPSVLTIGSKCDIIKARSPHSCGAIDVTIMEVNSVSTNNHEIVLDANVASNVKVGDYINLAEETIIPQVPPELHGLLAQRVVARCLEALGDANGLQAANAKIAELEQKTGPLIDNRVENAPQKVKNRWGILSYRRRKWW
jgi:hypothetical protein